MTPEAKVKLRIRKVLNELEAYYCMPMTGGYGHSGVPDFIVCYKGKFIGIEAKAGKGKATALQLYNLARIKEAGGIAWIIDELNVNQLRTEIENV